MVSLVAESSHGRSLIHFLSVAKSVVENSLSIHLLDRMICWPIGRSSMPSAFIPASLAANKAVPLPANGSNTLPDVIPYFEKYILLERLKMPLYTYTTGKQAGACWPENLQADGSTLIVLLFCCGNAGIAYGPWILFCLMRPVVPQNQKVALQDQYLYCSYKLFLQGQQILPQKEKEA